MATLQTVVQDVMARKGSIAIKRLSLKVGADLTQVLSGAMPPTATLETKVQAAMRELGF